MTDDRIAALAEILACPVCRQALSAEPAEGARRWLRCLGCGRYYPIQDGIPVMIPERSQEAPPK